MAPVYRIYHDAGPTFRPALEDGQGAPDYRSYLDRLTRMIPADMVALYLGGGAFISADDAGTLVFWSLLCFVFVIGSRIAGTRDPKRGKGVQWMTVILSALAFVIWVYSLGGPFVAYPTIYKPAWGRLAVLAWTAITPYFYQGEPA